MFFASTVLFSQGKERFQIEVQGNSIIIHHFDLNANCSAKFNANVNIDKNKIIVSETDVSSQKTRCNCNMDLVIQVNRIPQGDYKLIVERDEYKKYGYSKDTSVILHSSDVKIKSSGSKLLPAVSVEQTECKSQQNKAVSPKANEVLVYPNPSSSNFTLNFELIKDADVTIQLYNFLGKLVTSFQRSGLTAGSNSVTFSAKDLQPGMYIGKLITSNGRVINFRLSWSK